MIKRTPQEQVAFDSGAGHRCLTHDRTNHYCPSGPADLHAAWDAGWQKTEEEANRYAARFAPGMTDLMVTPESIPADLGKGDPLVDPQVQEKGEVGRG